MFLYWVVHTWPVSVSRYDTFKSSPPLAAAKSSPPSAYKVVFVDYILWGTTENEAAMFLSVPIVSFFISAYP